MVDPLRGVPIPEEYCECEGEHGLFVWRSDPDWWSCDCCDGRVRLITDEERADRARRKGASDA